MNILVIGAGNMGVTYAEGMMSSSIIGRKKIKIYDVDRKKKEALREEGDFEVYDNLEDILPGADIVFLAVKPYHSQALFEEMKSLVHDSQLIVSVMAGVSLQMIRGGLGIG